MLSTKFWWDCEIEKVLASHEGEEITSWMVEGTRSFLSGLPEEADRPKLFSDSGGTLSMQFVYGGKLMILSVERDNFIRGYMSIPEKEHGIFRVIRFFFNE
jgi:hypothetical protein